MSTIDLVFDGRAFPVPKKSVFELLERRELFEAKTYPVQSSVPLDVFETFVDSLTTQTKIPVTKGNAVSLWFLANEFVLSEVASECGTFPVSVDQFATLFERVAQLEGHISSLSNPARELEDEIESQERGLETLGLALEKMKTSIEGELIQLKRRLRRPLPTPKPPASALGTARPPPASKPPASRQHTFPLQAPKSLDGIISYLAKKYGGNVHEKRIVAITSRSVRDRDCRPASVADLTTDGYFCSQSEPGQWVCWDFGGMRLYPVNYTLGAWRLRSWVVEGSLDGKKWSEIDRHTNSQDFQAWGWVTATFPVAQPIECRLIRLTQTDRRLDSDDHDLGLRAVEFFGRLSE
jgi:hypothetical protein